MKNAAWATTAAILVAFAVVDGQERVRSRVQQERGAFLTTLEQLVSIESGSRDIEGLTRIGDVIASRLRALGGEVELVSPAADITRFEDTPKEIGRAVLARFRGTGSRRILMLAHMDTVYERGMAAQQPFRVEGTRASGLGIADDKQGVALILHSIAILRDLGFREYGLLTVLINGDEEISSAGSRGLIAKLGSEHDVVLSCEGAGANDSLRLAVSGNGTILLKVQGRASHAGDAPEQGRNALYEMAHQILQMRDLSDPASGRKVNWTLASAGAVRNVIPATAAATADVRVRRVSDWDVIEREVRQRTAKTLIPDIRVQVSVERRRPPLEPTPASRTLAEHAARIYAELGKRLGILTEGAGGATDAAIAASSTKAAVIEGMGVQGFGAHSNANEYIDITSIEPRLYLMTRLIMDISLGKTG